MSGGLQGAGGIGGLLARTDNSLLLTLSTSSSAHAYYYYDGNGNVAGLVNTNGLFVAQYTYDPFGNILTMSGPLASANTYRFSSKEWNDNAGLYYYGRRFYDPNLQRWLNRDPILERGGVNLYEFVANSPMRYVDAMGLDYGVCYITGFLGAPHQVVIGSDGKGGSYSLDFGPATHSLGNLINGPGKYNYTPYSLMSLNQAAAAYGGISNPQHTTPAVDAQLNAMAEALGQNNNTPNYSVCGNNCLSTAPKFDSLAPNLMQFGTPYSPINTSENLPPAVATSPNCNCH